MVPQRIGSVSGRNIKGDLHMVSLYRDPAGIKLCGSKGSLIVADMDAVLPMVADHYALSDTALLLKAA
ncbi:hypothetical protein ACFOMD_01185 [Sphingoaurantiacus capsulatus]|uniref:Uncharacterized protein n=1 Tax=Sphingoaurantiacus capsulatus TaxID=1771310 RepID=A0ABV7X943_9SPHN